MKLTLLVLTIFFQFNSPRASACERSYYYCIDGENSNRFSFYLLEISSYVVFRDNYIQKYFAWYEHDASDVDQQVWDSTLKKNFWSSYEYNYAFIIQGVYGKHAPYLCKKINQFPDLFQQLADEVGPDTNQLPK